MAVPPSEPNFAEPDALPTLHLDSLKSVALDDLELETADEAASNQHLSHEVRLARLACTPAAAAGASADDERCAAVDGGHDGGPADARPLPRARPAPL